MTGSIPTRSNGDPKERRRSTACTGVCWVVNSKFPAALNGLEVTTPLRGRGTVASWLVDGRWERVAAIGGGIGCLPLDFADLDFSLGINASKPHEARSTSIACSSLSSSDSEIWSAPKGFLKASIEPLEPLERRVSKAECLLPASLGIETPR